MCAVSPERVFAACSQVAVMPIADVRAAQHAPATRKPLHMHARLRVGVDRAGALRRSAHPWQAALCASSVPHTALCPGGSTSIRGMQAERTRAGLLKSVRLHEEHAHARRAVVSPLPLSPLPSHVRMPLLTTLQRCGAGEKCAAALRPYHAK